MKEEQNASSSANYDVELFHHGESHARLLGDLLEWNCLIPHSLTLMMTWIFQEMCQT